MANTKTIEFEIIKEPWNKYQIVDNSILKTRTVLKKIERVMDGDKVLLHYRDLKYGSFKDSKL